MKNHTTTPAVKARTHSFAPAPSAATKPAQLPQAVVRTSKTAAKMGPGVKLITEAPNIENTIPVSLYQASSPEKFSLEEDDKFVLYGGGTKFHLQVLDNDPTHHLQIHPQLQLVRDTHVSLFVLNTSFIIWLEEACLGLEIGYQSIILHALQNLAPATPALYLQLVSNEFLTSVPAGPSEFTPSVELVVTAAGASHQNPLFAHQPASSLAEIYDALSECSSFHHDDDSDGDAAAPLLASLGPADGPALAHDGPAIPVHWIQNSGNADDLEMDEGDSDGPESGMNVDVGFAQIVGSIRRRDETEDDVDEVPKTRRLQ